jgi:thioredoxin reductase
MLLVKQGASVQNCSKEIYFAMGVFAAIFTDVAGLNVVITAGTDGQHNIGSLHSRGLAIDIRNKTLTAEQKDAIFTRAKAQLETLGFDVIREEEHSTVATTGEHFHCEFQPKEGERFIHSTL